MLKGNCRIPKWQAETAILCASNILKYIITFFTNLVYVLEFRLTCSYNKKSVRLFSVANLRVVYV